MAESKEHRNPKKRYPDGMFNPREDNVGIIAEFNKGNNVNPRKKDFVEVSAKLSAAKLRNTQ